MATHEDVRRIAQPLPGATESTERFGFSVAVKGKDKGFLWLWSERVQPKKARVVNPNVLAVIVPNLTAKALLLESDPENLFTEPHYNGFPAVLVRLETIGLDALEDLIVEAWRCKAPPDVVKQFDQSG